MQLHGCSTRTTYRWSVINTVRFCFARVAYRKRLYKYTRDFLLFCFRCRIGVNTERQKHMFQVSKHYLKIPNHQSISRMLLYGQDTQESRSSGLISDQKRSLVGLSEPHGTAYRDFSPMLSTRLRRCISIYCKMSLCIFSVL